MSGRFLLDTNIVIALFASDPGVQQQLMAETEIFIPAIVLGELYYGARKSGQRDANLTRIDEFAAQSAILPCDQSTAHWYGQVKDGLRAKGRPIPENDIWIAALALQHRLTLATRDSHFNEVDGLSIETW
jgi:tRNA(fMet)-specific endonuclease VapC